MATIQFVQGFSLNAIFERGGRRDGGDRHHKTHPLVEGTDQGSMDGVGGGLARLDPRRLRFHHFLVSHGADRQRFRRPADGGDDRLHPDLVDAPSRRDRRRLARRPNGPQDAANDLDRRLLVLQFHRRFLAELLVFAAISDVARRLHGGGVAGRRGLGDGDLADPLARLYGRGFARIVGSRRGFVGRRVRPAIRFYRLARPIDDGGVAGFFDHLCAVLRQGTAGLGREPADSAQRAPRGPHAAAQYLQAGYACQHAARLLVHGQRLCYGLFDRRVVSDLSAKGSSTQRGPGRVAAVSPEPGVFSLQRALGLDGRPRRPALGDPGARLPDAPGYPALSDDRRLHDDRRVLRVTGRLRRRRHACAIPTLSGRAVSDRGARDGERLLLSSGGDLGRVRTAGAHLLRDHLEYGLRHSDDDRNRGRLRQHYRGDPIEPRDQGQGAGGGRSARLIRPPR